MRLDGASRTIRACSRAMNTRLQFRPWLAVASFTHHPSRWMCPAHAQSQCSPTPPSYPAGRHPSMPLHVCLNRAASISLHARTDSRLMSLYRIGCTGHGSILVMPHVQVSLFGHHVPLSIGLAV